MRWGELVAVVAVLSAVAGGAIADGPPGSVGDWVISDTTAPLDGQRNYIAHLNSREKIANIIDHDEAADLVFICGKGGFFASIKWPDFVDRGEGADGAVNVSWKLDNGAIHSESWQGIDRAVFRPGQRGVDQLRDWAGGKVLVMRVADKHGGQDVTFDLTGIDTVYATLAARSCG